VRRAAEALLSHLDYAVAVRRGDWSLNMDSGVGGGWRATVRVTQHPNVRDTPDRSTVYFQTGGVAEDALEPALQAAIADVEAWDMTAPRPATHDGRVDRRTIRG